MNFKERQRRHDDAHVPLGGTGKRANHKQYDKPAASLVTTKKDEPLWPHGRDCICPICVPVGKPGAH